MIDYCMKYQINDDMPIVLKSNYSSIDMDNLRFSSGASEEVLHALGFMYKFYDYSANDFWAYNVYEARGPNLFDPSRLVIGSLVDSSSDISQPENTVSLVTYNKDTIKQSLARVVPDAYEGSAESWENLVLSAAFEELNELLAQYPELINDSPVAKEVALEPLTLRITSMTEQELMEQGNMDEKNYQDAFGLISSLLGATNSTLGLDPNMSQVSVTGPGEITITAQVTYSLDASTEPMMGPM